MLILTFVLPNYLLIEHCEPNPENELISAVTKEVLCPGQNGILICKVINSDQIGWTVDGESAVYPGGRNPQNLPNSTAYFIEDQTGNFTSFLIYVHPGVSAVVNINCCDGSGWSCTKVYTVMGTGNFNTCSLAAMYLASYKKHAYYYVCTWIC